MKYRLKDRSLQQKLDALSDRDFSKLLDGVEDTGFSALRIPLCGFIEDAGQTIPRVEVYVRREDLEEVCKDTSDELRARIQTNIKHLHTMLQYTQKSIKDDEPLEVEMKWLCARGIISSINALIEKYIEEDEE